MIRTTLRFAALGVACAACTDLNSADLKTQGMSAHIVISADGTGASNASAVLNVDTNITDYVQLTSGDTLATTAGGQTETMSQTNVLGIITYAAAFTGKDQSGAQYTVALTRSAGNTSAPSSTATMPGPFTITAPTSGQTFSRASADISVTYNNSGQADPVSWLVTGDCINAVNGQTLSGDPGSFTIPKGSLVPSQNQGSTNQNCTATLQITRKRAGSLDPAYFGGSIDAEQDRTVTFSSTP